MRCKPHPKALSSAQRPWSHRAPHTRDGSGAPEQSKTPLAGSLTSSKSQPQPSRGNMFQQGSSPAPAASDSIPAAGPSEPSQPALGEHSVLQTCQQASTSPGCSPDSPCSDLWDLGATPLNVSDCYHLQGSSFLLCRVWLLEAIR